MQKLKCIGGACNGYIVEVDNYYREGDQVPVYVRVEFRLLDFEEEVRAFREKRVPDTMINPIVLYKIAVFNFNQYNRLKFLIPVSWSNEDAMRYALGA